MDPFNRFFGVMIPRIQSFTIPFKLCACCIYCVIVSAIYSLRSNIIQNLKYARYFLKRLKPCGSRFGFGFGGGAFGGVGLRRGQRGCQEGEHQGEAVAVEVAMAVHDLKLLWLFFLKAWGVGFRVPVSGVMRVFVGIG